MALGSEMHYALPCSPSLQSLECRQTHPTNDNNNKVSGAHSEVDLPMLFSSSTQFVSYFRRNEKNTALERNHRKLRWLPYVLILTLIP